MKKSLQFGENVKGFKIPVLNEREIRAAAGILFLFTYTSLMLILFKNNFILIKYVISMFLLDFLIRVFVSPKYSPTLILGRLIVKNQTPEYVGARQKKFSWIIGIALAFVMFVFMVLMNAYGPISGIICLICLIFLFFESAFGICIGCKMYPWFFKDKLQYCPGEVCDIKSRQDIQKISIPQILTLLAFIAVIIAVVFLFNDFYSLQPYDFFGVADNSRHK